MLCYVMLCYVMLCYVMCEKINKNVDNKKKSTPGANPVS